MIASCILDQHQQTVSHAECSIENCHRMHTCIHHLHDETLILPIHEHLQLHMSQYKQKTQHPSHPLLKHSTYFNIPMLINPLSLTMAATYKHFHRHHTITTTDIKTNMCHIHTSIVSMYLATRGINKILRTPPPHISRSGEILHRLTHRILTQLRTNNHPSSNHIYTVDAKY